MHFSREVAHFSAERQVTKEKLAQRKSKKVLQRFPKRCTGTPIDARGSSTQNAASL